MSNIYVEPVALLRLLLDPRSSGFIAQALERAETRVSSRLTLLEARYVLHKIALEHLEVAAQRPILQRNLDDLLAGIDFIDITADILKAAIDLNGLLKPLEAIHVATVMFLRKFDSSIVLLACNSRIKTALLDHTDN